MSTLPPTKAQYEANVKCLNCGFGRWYGVRVKIPKGVQIEKAKCPDCGCETLVKA